MRVGNAARQQQRLINASVTLVTVDPFLKRGGIFDDTRREMWHRIKPFVPQTRGGGDHILDRGALDVGDIDAGARRQEIAEIVDLFRRARHDLDRISFQEIDKGAVVDNGVFFAERQKGHECLLQGHSGA